MLYYYCLLIKTIIKSWKKNALRIITLIVLII